MHELMERLHQDHRNLTRLFDLLEEQVERYRMDSDRRPDLPLILDIVHYLNDYPKIYHHPLEEQAIGLMRERKLGDSAVNALIHDQHRDLEESTEQLARLFEMVASDHAVPIEKIREALDTYLSLSREHLQAEDERLFPLMEQVLGDQEWEVIASRLPGRDDPLVGDAPGGTFDELKSRF